MVGHFKKRRRTLLGVEVDLDGGVTARVEDLENEIRSGWWPHGLSTTAAYLASVDLGDRHGGWREGCAEQDGGGLLKSAQN